MRVTVSLPEEGVSVTVIVSSSLPAGLKAAAVVLVGLVVVGALNQSALAQVSDWMAITRSCRTSVVVLALGVVGCGASRGLRAVAWLQVPPPEPLGIRVEV